MRLALLLSVFVPATAAFAQTVPSYQPLTGSQRWHRYWKDTILSPGLYFAAAGAASGAQLGNDPPEWGQGVEGYAKRSASLLGTFVLQETIHQGGAALLGYDPRYQNCACKGFFSRSGHAIKWTFLTRNTKGAARFNLPLAASAYGSGMLSMYWYPARFNPLSDGVRLGNQQMGFEVGVSLLREFTPELKRLFKLRKKP